MSAIAPTAAEKRTSFHVGFVPQADITYGSPMEMSGQFYTDLPANES
jgi:hypothetical protein